MKAIVVYESMYGNTRGIAEAIAEGLGGARVVHVSKAGLSPQADLLVVGGPTHVHGIASLRSRQAAASAAREDGGHLEPEAEQEPGLRSWLRDLEHVDARPAATFDTRVDRAPWFTGVASRGIARRLRQRGYQVVGSESFLVMDSEGPLEDGELERARAWGAGLAQRQAVRAEALS